ncbi:MAG: site-specific integrase [Gammaproteobacteria bacterium]|nr:site-specific integrase [Rhodospirillaceae bacterium]MDE0364048.1 site-specific integrase [Gammaproteobacteria bacterium]
MLTERTVRDLKPGDRTRILWDSKLKGLGCRITPAGSSAFVLRYRDAKGKQRLVTLARTGEVSLKEVRELAGKELLKIRMGETDLLSRRQKRRRSVTVAQGIRIFFEQFCPKRVQNGRMTPRTVREYEKQAARYLIPAIGKLDIDEVRRSQIERMVNPLRPVLRNRILALASRLFRYFEDQGLRHQYSNPCRGVERSREEPRDRTLKTTEIFALCKALAKESVDPARRAVIHIAILTGLRISEVISLRWDCVNFETGSVLLPTTKTGRRNHPLSAAALDALKRLPVQGNYVFCTDPTKPVSYTTVRLAFLKAATAAGLTDVRLHDLRRTFMTRAAESGVSSHTLRDLLGHKTATMADRYVRRANIPVVNATNLVSGDLAKILDAV